MKLSRWLLVAALAFGCDDGGGSSDGDQGVGEGGAGGVGGEGGDGAGGVGGGDGPCVPAAEDYPAIAETIATYCGECHGEIPQFGAPQDLVTEAALRDELERVVVRIEQGTMPPAGQPEIPDDERAALLAWATCGDVVEPPPNPGGFDVTREIFPDPGERPAGTEVLEWRATDGGIDADSADLYRCWSFGGTDQERFIRRMEPIIDDARVLHHMVVYQVGRGGGDGGEVPCGSAVDNIVYAWAPGQQALSFPEGGLRTGPDRRYILEIHYNNTARLGDVTDESGLRLFHAPPEGVEVGMLSLGPEGFSVPAGEQKVVGGQCDVQREHQVIAAFPHMHEIGYALQSTLYRDGGDDPEDFITLTGWDFNAQYFYAIPTTIGPGDRIVTECTFRNMTERRVSYGPRTQDEMCYNFVYVTPPPARGQCNTAIRPPDAPMGYQPGECAGPGAGGIEVELVEGRYLEGTPPPHTGGDAPAGEYALVGSNIWREDFVLPVATLDTERSYSEVRGTLILEDNGFLSIDFNGVTHLYAETGLSLDRDAAASLAGQVTGVEGHLAQIDGSCGPAQGPYALPFTAGDGRISLDLPVDEIQAIIRLDFELR